eukprot:10367-Pelagococcus_subviridis.AAC.5
MGTSVMRGRTSKRHVWEVHVPRGGVAVASKHAQQREHRHLRGRGGELAYVVRLVAVHVKLRDDAERLRFFVQNQRAQRVIFPRVFVRRVLVRDGVRERGGRAAAARVAVDRLKRWDGRRAQAREHRAERREARSDARDGGFVVHRDGAIRPLFPLAISLLRAAAPRRVRELADLHERHADDDVERHLARFRAGFPGRLVRIPRQRGVAVARARRQELPPRRLIRDVASRLHRVDRLERPLQVAASTGGVHERVEHRPRGFHLRGERVVVEGPRRRRVARVRRRANQIFVRVDILRQPRGGEPLARVRCRGDVAPARGGGNERVERADRRRRPALGHLVEHLLDAGDVTLPRGDARHGGEHLRRGRDAVPFHLVHDLRGDAALPRARGDVHERRVQHSVRGGPVRASSHVVPDPQRSAQIRGAAAGSRASGSRARVNRRGVHLLRSAHLLARHALVQREPALGFARVRARLDERRVRVRVAA